MEFVDVQRVRGDRGVRIVVVGGVPSPWSEAAKAVFHVKRIPFVVARGRAGDPAIEEWLPGTNFPVVLHDDEPRRTGHAEILALAERLVPTPRLVPEADAARLLVHGLAHEILGEGGLVWNTRMRAIQASLDSEGAVSFPLRIAQRLATRYVPAAADHAAAKSRSLAVLALLARQLESSGGPYYLGDTLSAVDLYSAAALHALAPLPHDVCPMVDAIRSAFQWMRDDLGADLPAALLTHRTHVLGTHLEMPMQL